MSARATLAAILAVTIFTGCTRLEHPHFLDRAVVVNGRTYHYRVWLPHHYTKLRRWPVVLFLHGSGERGDDNLRQVTVGIGPALKQFGERYRCVVVLPQCAFGKEWYGEQETQALAALDASIAEFRGDRRRVSITGISMGGAGTWYLARHRRFAAVVPVCGEVKRQPDDLWPEPLPPDLAAIVDAADPFAALAAAMGNVPVWAFHGSADNVIPATQSRDMVAALRHRGDPARYTEYPGVGHNSWDAAYADHDMVRWLLQQRR